MKIETIVRADRMYLASLFQSTEETRYYLNGVYVHPYDGAVNVAATDGHTLAVLREDVGIVSDPQIVKLPKAALQIIKSKRCDSLNHWLVITDGGNIVRRRAFIIRHVLSDGDDLFALLTAEISNQASFAEAWAGIVEIIDGTFPDYLKVIPTIGERSGTPAVQARFMDRFSAVALFRGSAMPAIALQALNEKSPVVVDVVGQRDFVGVVMPVRCDLRGTDMPSWAMQTKPDEAINPPTVKAPHKKRSKVMQPA